MEAYSSYRYIRNKVCRAGAKVVAFYAHEDESLLTVRTYLTQNSTSEIILSNYANNDTTNITLLVQIKRSLPQMPAFNINNNSSSLISIFGTVTIDRPIINTFYY